MKRKLFALMMAGVMACSFAPAAFAEAESETEMPSEISEEINWSDVESEIEDNEAWAGDFVTFDEVALKMYLPASFIATELTDEDIENGYIAYYTTEDQTASIGVQYIDMDGMELTDYADLITSEYNVEDCEYVLLNGLDAITYTNPDNKDVSVVAFATEQGYVLEFAFSPITDEDFAAVAAVIASSIQAEE